MKKLFKYLKPFSFGLLIAVGLLYVQASMDLALPTYLSKIVNVGIMAEGIEHASPVVISEQGYEFVQAVLPEDRATVVADQYTFEEAGASLNIDGLIIDDYPNVYIRNSNISVEALEDLDQAFGETVWTVINVMQTLAETSGVENAFDSQNINIQQLYALPTLLSSLPNGAGTLALTQAQTMSSSVDPQLKKQSGIVFVSNVYYAELGIDVAQLQMNYILLTGAIMLGLTLIGVVASILVSFISSKIGAGVAKRMRRDVFAKVESFSMQEFNQFATSSLITRTTNDITQVQQLIVISIRLLFYAPIIAIGGILNIFRTNASMTWIIGVAVLSLITIIVTIFIVAIPKFQVIQKFIDRLNLVAREGLSGLMVIRAFGNQKFEEKRFDKANVDLTKTTLFVNRIVTVMMPFMMLVMNVTVLAIIWFGSHEVANSNLQIGDMLAFMNYSMQVIMAFLFISMLFIFVPRAAVSLKRISEVLDAKPVIINPDQPTELKLPIKGIVRFEHVSFRFGNATEDVLSDISFTAMPGQTTAIIGSTGSGKSTLVNLIPRFYDVTKGRITLDGVDIRDINQEDLRSHISYVPQRGMILSGTIASNLKYGRPEATDAEMEQAAAVAQAREFIDDKEDKFQSEVAQGGANVSGGQKQRLSIARALVKNAPVVIFDDSFSALDFQTDQKLRRAMKKTIKGATLIIVAQRVGTIMNADRIIVMDDGKIIAQGTHDELLASCPVYFEIASSQLAKEELAHA